MAPTGERSASTLRAKLEAEAYVKLRDLVVAAGGIDLNLYKDQCILRRIAVRQRACGAPQLRAYLRLVSRDPVERGRLVKALTIHVSQFFRNPTAFEAIRRRVLPVLQAEKIRSEEILLRVWSAGCACGEEAYSLAILFLEVLPDTVRKPACAIYGTDIEPDCLRQAREGRYPAGSLVHVPERWRRRYFTAVGGMYQVRPMLRRLVYFRTHNILDPPPFGRLDLIVFRNVLIYMTEGLQERVLGGLHAALKPGGFLVLGKVEGLSGATHRLFEAVDVGERVYRKRV